MVHLQTYNFYIHIIPRFETTICIVFCGSDKVLLRLVIEPTSYTLHGSQLPNHQTILAIVWLYLFNLWFCFKKDERILLRNYNVYIENTI